MHMNKSRSVALLDEADIGGSAAARVPVAPPQPLLTAHLEAPGLLSAPVLELLDRVRPGLELRAGSRVQGAAAATQVL